MFSGYGGARDVFTVDSVQRVVHLRRQKSSTDAVFVEGYATSSNGFWSTRGIRGGTADVGQSLLSWCFETEAAQEWGRDVRVRC